jgi:hypothetical protein
MSYRVPLALIANAAAATNRIPNIAGNALDPDFSIMILI